MPRVVNTCHSSRFEPDKKNILKRQSRLHTQTLNITGITQKLSYLQETGVDAIWLAPIFLSPMYDAGYDISEYRQIAPEFGTMEDFKTLLSKAKESGNTIGSLINQNIIFFL